MTFPSFLCHSNYFHHTMWVSTMKNCFPYPSNMGMGRKYPFPRQPCQKLTPWSRPLTNWTIYAGTCYQKLSAQLVFVVYSRSIEASSIQEKILQRCTSPGTSNHVELILFLRLDVFKVCNITTNLRFSKVVWTYNG